MPRTDNEIRVVPSVLDRLLDYEPEVSSESVPSRAKSLRQMKQSVRRDLEWLLNARQSSPIPSAESVRSDAEAPSERTLSAEVHNSLISYGLPDFSSASSFSVLDQNRIRRALELAVERFEPRLRDVVVKVLPARETERALRFRIEARLRVEPAPEPVTFDTVLQIHSGEYQIEAR